MMLALIASQHGAELAANVAEAILHSPIRHHSEHQRMSLPARIGARHPKLVGIIEEMEDNLEEPLSPSVLAKQAGLSTRQLERLFRRYLDRSPKRYYLELRLKKARSLLLQTDMSVINVALACGFSSPSHFSKCYRAFYGRTPYRERGVPIVGRRSESRRLKNSGLHGGEAQHGLEAAQREESRRILPLYIAAVSETIEAPIPTRAWFHRAAAPLQCLATPVGRQARPVVFDRQFDPGSGYRRRQSCA